MRSIMMSTIGLLTAITANGEYSLKVSNGNLPDEVTTENLNGNVPIEEGYKHGWTDKGCTSGDFGSI